MRFVRYLLVVFFALVLFARGGINVLAMETGFSTELLAQEDIDTFINNIEITVLTEEPEKRSIECFSVNETGAIAIGCSDSDLKTVCIYSGNGQFQYGYRFKCSGTFGVELTENLLNIYFVRSNVAMAVDPMGNIADICSIPTTQENNSYWNHSVFLTTRRVGDTEYSIKNDTGLLSVFDSSYSQLVATNANGEEMIVYDTNANQYSTMIIVGIGIVVLVSLAVFIIVRRTVKLKRG